MRIEVNWADVTGGLILLCLVVLIAVTWCFVASRRIAAEERRVRGAFERDMEDAELPPWNGDSYNWTPESLAYMNDTNLYAGPDVADTTSFEAVPDEPVPPSTISGPLPVMASDDDFMARLKADNTAFLARLEMQE
jgi:hypothetical protein